MKQLPRGEQTPMIAASCSKLFPVAVYNRYVFFRAILYPRSGTVHPALRQLHGSLSLLNTTGEAVGSLWSGRCESSPFFGILSPFAGDNYDVSLDRHTALSINAYFLGRCARNVSERGCDSEALRYRQIR